MTRLCRFLLVFVLGWMPIELGHALSSPFDPLRERDYLVAIQQRSTSDFALIDGNPQVISGDESGLYYAWFDGLIWRQRHVISSESVRGRSSSHVDAPDTLPVEAIGNTLHVIAQLSAPPLALGQLTHLVIERNTGVVLRRVALAPADVEDGIRSYLLLPDASGSDTMVIYLREDGSVRTVTGLASTPLHAPLPALVGRNVDELHDALRIGSSTLWVAYSTDVLRVAGISSQGGMVDDEVDPIGADHAGLVRENNGGVAIAYSNQQSEEWRRRTEDGWICPATSEDSCGISDLDGGIFVSAASDTGHGYFSVLTRHFSGDEGNRVRVRRIFFGGSFADRFVASRAGSALRLRAAFGAEQTLFSRGTTGSSSGPPELGLYLRMPPSMPWRSFSTNHALIGALAMAIDREGEAVAIGDGGPSIGLRRSRWDPFGVQHVMSALRPASEHYAEAALAFASDGTLHALLRAQPSNDVVHLQAAPGQTIATRTVLASATEARITPQIAVDDDGQVFISWFANATGELRLGRRAEASSPWTLVTAAAGLGADAQPQLALTGTGRVLVSAYDASLNRVRVWSRVTRDDAATFELVMGTDANVAVPAHALAGTPDGNPSLAYVRTGEQGEQRVSQRFIRRLAEGVVEQEERALAEPVDASRPIQLLRMALVAGSPSDARLLFAARDTAMNRSEVFFARRTARSPEALFEVQSLGTADDEELAGGMALLAGADGYVGAVDFGRLQILRHTTVEDANAPGHVDRLHPVPVEPGFVSGQSAPPLPAYRNSMCICEEGEACDNSITGTLPPRGVGVGGTADLSLLLRTRFAQTPNGRYYLDLFAQHGLEMAQLMLADPFAAARRANAYQLFVHGLRAFADGDGSRFTMSAPMLESAREVWQYWVDNGSPELAAAVARELQRTDNLQSFAGMSFEQWFATLPGEPPVFADGFE